MAEPVSHSAERVLIVEDDPATRSGLTELVRTWGFTAESAADGAEALERVTTFRPSIIVSDMVMPRMSGMELLKAIKAEGEHIKIVLLTAQGTVDTAVEAVKAGAEDYLTKPLDPAKLQRLLERLAEINRQKRENQVLRRQLNDRGRFGRIIGNSPRMRALYQVLEQAAPTPASMLILGESGTGKELVAQTIHQLSPRAAAPFIALNCAAIPDTLLESEIFGHEKGAFTGATERRAGCFELADRGTLFLDEIGDLPMECQSSLLRFLQEGSFERVGGHESIRVDLRIISATHQDLQTAIAEGRFRADLYHRLCVLRLQQPPLRERGDDIDLLAASALHRYASEGRRLIRGFSSCAVRAMHSYGWPGNVRELINRVRQAVVMAEGRLITASDLHLSEDAYSPVILQTLEEARTEAECAAIGQALRRNRNRFVDAARDLGVSRVTLYRLMDRHGLRGSEASASEIVGAA